MASNKTEGVQRLRGMTWMLSLLIAAPAVAADPPSPAPGGGPAMAQALGTGACSGIASLPSMSASVPFRTGEELGFRLTVAGAYVGRLETKVGAPRKVDGRQVVPLFGRARTSAIVASLQPMVGRYMAMVQPDSLQPLGLQVELTYGEDPRWEKVRFEDGSQALEAKYFAQGREGERGYTTDHPATDLLTLLYLSRRVQLQPGLQACQDVFGARRLWRMTGQVTGTEVISTPVGKKEAYRLQLHFVRKPHPSLRKFDPPTYDMVVFVSKDRYQTPLRFELDVDGVTAVGHLERWSLSGSEKDWEMMP